MFMEISCSGIDIARCVGLWLAEGDNKTSREITFTNNCLELIDFFKETIEKIFPLAEGPKPRMYVYLPRAGKFDIPFNSRIKIYMDTRARKPYCIYRVSGVKLVKQWKGIVSKYALDKEMHPYILQGFFAGEGNVKFNRALRSRTIRIAQGKRNRLLENILEENGVRNRYSIDEKAYVITARGNLEKLAKIEVAILHPEKNKKFNEMLATYKQHHYPRHYFRRKIYEMLKVPRTSQELAELFGRSVARVQDTLKVLKDGGKVQNFKVRSNVFWIRSDQKTIMISDVKTRYLDLLKMYGTLSTVALARERDVDFKSAYRRLKELKKLGLVRRNPVKKWELCAISKRIISIDRKESRAQMKRVEY